MGLVPGAEVEVVEKQPFSGPLVLQVAWVERTLGELLDGGERFDADRVRHTVRPERPSVPTVTIGAPDLKAYDALLA